MLSRIKMDYPEIRRALLEIDDEKLSVDDLKAISKQLPTSEEVCPLPLCIHISSSLHRFNESKILTILENLQKQINILIK